MLKAKADVEVRQVNQATPLHFAAENGHTETLKVLINAKADVEAKAVNAATPPTFSSTKRAYRSPTGIDKRQC